MTNRPIDRSHIRRILVRATNWVGDGIMTLPALEALKENFPAADLTVLARPWVAALFEAHPAVDGVLVYDAGKGPLQRLGEVLRAAGRIRRHRFDLAILFQNAFEAAFLACLGGIPFRIGYNTDGRGLLLTHPLRRDKGILGRHQVEYYLHILRAMGWEAKSRDPRLQVATGDIRGARSLLASKGIAESDVLVGLSPGAVYGPAKRWHQKRFAAVGDRAVERWGAKVLLLGSAGERGICVAVARAMRSESLDLCGRTTLGQAMALIGRCRLFVTNDSGLMHAAAALDVPTVAVFGSTDPVATGPRGERAVVVRRDMHCSPCLKPTCSTGYRCLLAIEPEEVWREMETLMENRR